MIYIELGKSLFDIDEQLPIKITLRAIDYPNQPISYGKINKIISDVKQFMIDENLRLGFDNGDFNRMKDNVKGLNVTLNNGEYILTNLKDTFISTTSSLFVTTYINGIKLVNESNS